MNTGRYYNSYMKELSKRAYTPDYMEKIQKCIETACQYCVNMASLSNVDEDSDKAEHPIMMLGKIQSGKTQAYTGMIFLAFDNDFDMVFILTKNSKALVQQTYKRMRKEFKSFIDGQKVEVFDIMQSNYEFTEFELEKKLVVVAKKETHNLDKISEFITTYMIGQRKNCIVIDDEADTTGIGFEKVKDSDEFDLRTVAKKVNDIRGNLDGYVFVQVTATPYALYLQPDFADDGSHNQPKPIKPLKNVLVPYGEGYIGGDYYFVDAKQENHPGRYIFEPVSPEEHELVSNQKRKGKKSKINDRRIFKEEEILTQKDKLQVFKHGLVNFVVGSCVLRIWNADTLYAYVIHTATQKTSHFSLESITKTFFNQIKSRNAETQILVEEMITESYNDIKKSVDSFGYTMPEFAEIKAAFYHAVDHGYISYSIINSENDVPGLLDEGTGELRLRSPFSIFIGGQVLDRGITIPHMIGFYYGRSPQNMQQDTVMQHSRMFGYRKPELLSVTRFYTTKRIYDNMTHITEIDSALREDIENGKSGEGIYFLQQSNVNGNTGRIIPCSPSKILLSNVVLLKPQRRLLPVGFTPIEKIHSSQIVKDIDLRLLNLIPQSETGAKIVLLDDVEPIIRLAFSALSPDEESSRFVTDDAFITSLKYMTGDSKELYLIVRRNKSIAKYKTNHQSFEDSPDTTKDELGIAKRVAIDKPALMLLHETGADKGWKDRPFWWPILVAPKNVPKTIFAMSEPDGKIKKP
jgi:hypothetical protein